VQAITLTEEVSSRLPKPSAVQINGKSISPDLTLQSISHDFSHGDYLGFKYFVQLPNQLSLLGDPENKVLPIAQLSESSRRTISEFDQLTKSWGDASCKEALIQLTTPR
jgi:hypothetical protein